MNRKVVRNANSVTTINTATAQANIASGPNTALAQPPTKAEKETATMSGPSVVPTAMKNVGVVVNNCANSKLSLVGLPTAEV